MDARSGPIKIRRSERARNVRLVVKPSGLELVVPVSFPQADALRFAHQHLSWGLEKLEAMRRRTAWIQQSMPQPIQAGDRISFQGPLVQILVLEESGQRLSISRKSNGDFTIRLRANDPRPVPLQIEAALLGWVRRWMVVEAHRIVSVHASRSNLVPREIRIKRMRTRWGSLGARNDMNLNWLLAFAPPEVLEYVVVHELCHIRHRNHAPAFWQLVEAHLPNWGEQRHWLKREGAGLFHLFSGTA